MEQSKRYTDTWGKEGGWVSVCVCGGGGGGGGLWGRGADSREI